MKAQIVIDLGFGDCGKGHTVDSLCMDAEDPIVVRFSGGQQCGHLVYVDKHLSHVHSSFGSGTLRGFPSYFTEDCTMLLDHIGDEYDVLVSKGCKPLMFMHPKCMMTTPYDVAYNRLTHAVHGHGSVGLGVGATMDRHLNTGHKIYAVDLTNSVVLEQKMNNLIPFYLKKLKPLGFDEDHFKAMYQPLLDEWHKYYPRWKEFFSLAYYDKLEDYQTLIFEGSQGVLLDMDHGIFPNVTFASTTCKNALDVTSRFFIRTSEIFYVTRCYLTRHGNGWLPDGENLALINNEMELNKKCEFQGEFKTRELSIDLLNYALTVDDLYINTTISKNLVVTCLDQLPEFDINSLTSKINTKFAAVYTSESHISKSMHFRMV